MSTFSQYWVSIKKTPEPRQITWVCGEEVVLTEYVVAHVTSRVAPETWNAEYFAGGADSDSEIWGALNAHPIGSSPRLVTIRHAELIQDWVPFVKWVKERGRNPRTYVVLVSSEERIPKTEVTLQQRRAGEKPQPVPHIAVIGTKGHVVECRPFTTATSMKALEWVRSLAPMNDPVARHLLIRANWDLRLVRDACVKLSVFPGDVTVPIVNALLEEQPRDSFSDALLALDRKTALRAAQSIPPEDLGVTIGLLESKLGKAGLIHDMQVDHASSSDMAKALGAQAFLLNDLLVVARHYDSRRCLSIRKVLALADSAQRAGQVDGVLEAIVALW